MKTRVIAWWSGGVASAYACWIALQTYRNVEVVFQDTHNEDPDTYRFLLDCEKLYGQPIVRISGIGDEYGHISDVWRRYKSLNAATGAICSTVLKREVREAYQNLGIDHAQVFGFDFTEQKRHLNMRRNYPEINAQSPLVDNKIDKEDCIRFFNNRGIEIPNAYKLGYRNNNCLMTGCVRGGIGYWKKYQKDFPERFNVMATREHELTELKGEPVHILKDRRGGDTAPLFLKHNPKYPTIKDLSQIKGKHPEAIVECNGFCGTLDFAAKTEVKQ